MYLTFYLAFGILSHSIDMLSRILAFSLLAIGDGDVWSKSRGHLAKGQRTYTFFAKNQIIGDQDPRHLPILWISSGNLTRLWKITIFNR